MNRTLLHTIAGTFAFFIIIAFWLSTVIVEMFFTLPAIAAVKTTIGFYGLPLLVVFMALTGISGQLLARTRDNALCQRKKARMRILALNGVVIMIPAALFLALRAEAGVFDLWFCVVQTVELAVGLIQMSLMGLNIRDGRQLSSQQDRFLPCLE